MQRYVFSDEQRKVLEGLSQPLAIYQFIDKRVATLVLSRGFLKLFGYESREEAYFDMDNDMYKDTHPDDVARIANAALSFATEGGTFEVIYRSKIKQRDGYRIIHANGEHVYTEDGVRLAHVWYTDEGAYASEDSRRTTKLNRKFNEALYEESLVHESKYDYLTGLPSMTYFFELAKEGKRAMLQSGDSPALLFMDLNGMKFFNGAHGFEEGNNLLREFARLLKSTFGSENSCRFGSDHFAVFTSEDGLEERLVTFFEDARLVNDGKSLPVRVGIYTHRMGDTTISATCDRAKLACDSLRDTYGSCYSYYERTLLQKAERRLYVLANLDRALENEWVRVHYQPIVRTVTGSVCDEEALSRWEDPEHGRLLPSDFIPALEDAGVIYKLDLYVLDKVLEMMRKKKEHGIPVVPCSINLSRSDFSACDIVSEVERRVDAAGVGRDKITIEVTESAMGGNTQFMREHVERFRNHGFKVWMDDFGSGYSSIDLLQSVEFDLVKFDMSFMRQFDENEGSSIVLTELVKMATALGIDTLCEGVETDEQVRFLREVGCSKLQGYYYCKPISFDEILAWVHKNGPIAYENPDDAAYLEAIGRTSLFDLASIASEQGSFLGHFETMPMCVLELDGHQVTYVRTNPSWRMFLKRYANVDLQEGRTGESPLVFRIRPNFEQLVKRSTEIGCHTFFNETMPDGSIAHSLVRHIGTSPVTGKRALTVAVLSVTDAREGTTYAEIAHALAADYHSIFYVDLKTESFIEYSFQAGSDELACERRGDNYFDVALSDIDTHVHEDDRARMRALATKDSIVSALNRDGTFMATYRRVSSGTTSKAVIKATRTHAGADTIIVGISIIDPDSHSAREHEKAMPATSIR